ncbi:MAG: RNA polymerase sigma factor [Acidiferrobacterales bacterium]
MISDKTLAARVALSRDHQAFTLLVERHQGAIRNYMRRLLVNDSAAADDLAQETFLTAFQKMGSWRGTAKLSTWLHSIAYRKFLDYQRKHRRQITMANIPDAGQDNRQALDAEIMAKHLMGLLEPKDRAVMTLAYGAGMTHAEIANVVDQPLGSVKARIHRAKLKLYKWLQDNDNSIQTQTTNKILKREGHNA